MSGDIRGRVDVVVNTVSSGNNAQEFFKTLYDFFVSHPNMTLISRNSGAASTSGAIAYWDQANPFRTNAWAVFKQGKTLLKPYPVYFQIQMSMALDFGVAPGSPGVAEASANLTVVAIQCAIGMGGDQNPFKGTMNAGSPNDTRANPAWGTPSGGTTYHVFPRSNTGTGSHAASANNFTILSQAATNACRYHIIADDDSLVILMDQSDNNSFSIYYAGTYEMRADLDIPRNFVSFGSFASALPLSIGSQYGTTAGSGLQGGMVFVNDSVRGVALDRHQTIVSSAFQPSFNDAYGEYGIPVCSLEPSALGVVAGGYAGNVSFIRETANVDTNDTNADFSRAVFGPSTIAPVKVVVPWSGLAAPKATSTRTGTSFSRIRTAADT